MHDRREVAWREQRLCGRRIDQRAQRRGWWRRQVAESTESCAQLLRSKGGGGRREAIVRRAEKGAVDGRAAAVDASEADELGRRRAKLHRKRTEVSSAVVRHRGESDVCPGFAACARAITLWRTACARNAFAVPTGARAGVCVRAPQQRRRTLAQCRHARRVGGRVDCSESLCESPQRVAHADRIKFVRARRNLGLHRRAQATAHRCANLAEAVHGGAELARLHVGDRALQRRREVIPGCGRLEVVIAARAQLGDDEEGVRAVLSGELVLSERLHDGSRRLAVAQ
eukprot:3655569-Prymnesium_polylepis.1